MKDFWKSDLGEIDGTNKNAFKTVFRNIPNNSYLIGQIIKAEHEEMFNKDCISIHWEISNGEYKGRKVFQNLFVYPDPDNDSYREQERFKALNMLRLLFDIASIPTPENAPTNQDLEQLILLKAGLRILETKPNAQGKQFNRIAEVHPHRGFEEKIGQYLIDPKPNYKEGKNVPFDELNDDVPF